MKTFLYTFSNTSIKSRNLCGKFHSQKNIPSDNEFINYLDRISNFCTYCESVITDPTSVNFLYYVNIKIHIAMCVYICMYVYFGNFNNSN